MFYIVQTSLSGPEIVYLSQPPIHYIGPAFPTWERAREYAEIRGIEFGPVIQPTLH